MLLDKLAQHSLVHRVEAADRHHLQITARLEHAPLVEDVGDAVRHAGGEVPADGPQYGDHAARHVLAAMVAGAFDHRHGAGVPHSKSVARGPGREQSTGRRAIQRRVAYQNTSRISGTTKWPDHNLAATQALADVVVRLAFEVQVHARQRKGAEALAGAAVKAQPNRLAGPRAAVDARDLTGDARADSEVMIADGGHAARGLGPRENLRIE